MIIRVNRTLTSGSLPNIPELGFGKYFADHLFLMDYSPEHGWYDPRIEPYHKLGLEPANLTLHYGQSIFEGAKAFRWKDGSVRGFRLDEHVRRFAMSAARMCMPAFNHDVVLEAIKSLIRVDHDWVPAQRGTALYLRPTLIAADNMLGVRASKKYMMFVITSPVGNYYASGTAPTRILVEEHYSRACGGGLGEAKTGANYAASLLAADQAKKRGFDQVLWLDARDHQYVEEVGTMNIFFVIDGTIITPPLDGTVLDGITRRSVLALSRHWGLPTEERQISMTEIVAAHESGRLQEVFGSGTAAVISQVGELNYQGKSMIIQEPDDSLRQRFFSTITAIQHGEAADTFGWTEPVYDVSMNGQYSSQSIVEVRTAAAIA